MFGIMRLHQHVEVKEAHFFYESNEEIKEYYCNYRIVHKIGI
jgi:hypothetical protein